jgi:hypothetical protein
MTKTTRIPTSQRKLDRLNSEAATQSSGKGLPVLENPERKRQTAPSERQDDGDEEAGQAAGAPMAEVG